MDAKLYYRNRVMNLLRENLTRVTDRENFIWFEGQQDAAVFNISASTLDYYVDGERVVTYECGRMFIIFAIRRSLVENFFS